MLSEIEKLLLANLHSVLPRSLPGRALHYTAGQWHTPKREAHADWRSAAHVQPVGASTSFWTIRRARLPQQSTLRWDCRCRRARCKPAIRLPPA
ncbi:hypothetical protein [Ideonella azotifigens]|uniref:hypothetical protein n=1 Tax=Ideonella azotifigens TaxID=513160 RepID=UPI001142EAC4|nr:hypothetical protein [Ideonella azotifigens]